MVFGIAIKRKSVELISLIYMKVVERPQRK